MRCRAGPAETLDQMDMAGTAQSQIKVPHASPEHVLLRISVLFKKTFSRVSTRPPGDVNIEETRGCRHKEVSSGLLSQIELGSSSKASENSSRFIYTSSVIREETIMIVSLLESASTEANLSITQVFVFNVLIRYLLPT